MKNVGFASSVALALLSLAIPHTALAQGYAKGNYQFILDDEIPKSVEFESRADEKGNATGYLTFIDQAPIPDPIDDDDEETYSEYKPHELYAKVELDRMTTEKNIAVMTGTVVDSSHRSFYGKRVQLVVQDNGLTLERPDRISWSFCRPVTNGWVPSDAEVKDDDGAYLRWWATDAEQKDDVGVPSRSLLPEGEDRCEVLFAAYTFADILKWEGDIIVEP